MLKGRIGLNRIMNPIVASLLEFNEAFEIPKLDTPGLGPDELIELRIKLLTEEVEEYAEAARSGDLVEVLDALADIGYILAAFWIIFVYILATFGIILSTFGNILATFWLHSGYFLDTFWIHFGYILGYIIATFWLHSCYILASFWLHFWYILDT